jgi:hypothetical protein
MAINVYFEVYTGDVNGISTFGYYTRTVDVEEHIFRHAGREITSRSQRVWLENLNTGSISYLKYRYGPQGTPVDMDEFLFIKLRSKWLR